MYLCHSILWVTSSYCQAQCHKTGFLEKWSLSTGHSSFSGVASTQLRLQSPTRSTADNLPPVLLPLLYQPQWEHPRPIGFWWSVTSISSSFHMRRDQDRGMKNWFACVWLWGVQRANVVLVQGFLGFAWGCDVLKWSMRVCWMWTGESAEWCELMRRLTLKSEPAALLLKKGSRSTQTLNYPDSIKKRFTNKGRDENLVLKPHEMRRSHWGDCSRKLYAHK